jgi:hypothetical protein
MTIATIEVAEMMVEAHVAEDLGHAVPLFVKPFHISAINLLTSSSSSVATKTTIVTETGTGTTTARETDR